MAPIQIIDTPQGPLRYAQAGGGRDVLLLHGAMTSVEDMLLGPFDPLARRFRVTAVERPGHGATPRRRLHGAPSDQAAHVLEAMAALGLERPVVVGQSFGAALAMDMAVAAPDRVQGVLAISPIVFPELRIEHLIYGPRAIPGLGEWIGYGPGRVIDAALLPVLWQAIFAPQAMPPHYAFAYPFALASGPGQMLALGEEAVQSLPDLAVTATRYPDLQVPLIVLSGGADWLSPPWTHAAKLVQAVPGAEWRVLPGLGHMLHHFAIDELCEAVRTLALGKTDAAAAQRIAVAEN